MMMNSANIILITGASGMIGSALQKRLMKDGYSNLLTPSHSELDLRDVQATASYFNSHKPEYVFHLAARVGGIQANSKYPAQFIYDNTAMQTSVFEAAHKSGVKKLLFPGSACTYPKLAKQPVMESELLTGSVEPTNIAYAVAKINGIIMAQSFAQEYGMSIVIPMLTNTYGVGDSFNTDKSHVIPALMQRFRDAKLSNLPEVVIWGTGKALREFIYVDDVVDAFIFLMQSLESHDIINVGTMQEVSINELAHKIAQIAGYTGKIHFDTEKPDGAPRKILDSNKLFGMGWKPGMKLEEGLRLMYDTHFKVMN